MTALTKPASANSQESPIERSHQSRFKSPQQAFWGGVRDGAGGPAMVLFAGMVGFGAMGNTNGLSLLFTGATSFFMFALPGQVVLLEIAISGSAAIAIALAVTLTATRFVTMTVTLFPQLHQQDRNRKLYASVHLLAMTAWAISMREFPGMQSQYRKQYFIGLGLLCWLISIPGTILGYFLAGMVPAPITLGLIFINPLFFLLTFTDVRPWINRLAICFGCLLGPVFYLLDRDSSLLTTGLVAGTIAYFIDRKLLRKRPGVIG